MTTTMDPPRRGTADAPTTEHPRVAAPVPPAVESTAAPASVVEDQPRTLTVRTVDDLASMFGSAAASLALVWIAYEHILAWHGVLGFLVAWWFTFLAFYAAVSAMGNPRPVVLARLASAVVQSGAAVIFGVVVSVMVFIFVRGWPALHHVNFYTRTMAGVRPTAPLTQGGILHAIVGSAEEIGIATAISLPLGVGTAVYLTEVGGRVSSTVRTVVEAMTALPDILAGLFIYAFLVIGLGWERTGFTAALALAVTMIPIIARSAEVVLRVVPSGLREAGMALGASKWQTTWRVVIPTARSGLATSLILGVARIAGETAPLLIVSGASTYFNKDPFHHQMNSLPLFIFTAVRSGEPLYIQRGYGAAALLLTLILILFVTTRFLARDKVRSR